jgi:hypothetical protein
MHGEADICWASPQTVPACRAIHAGGMGGPVCHRRIVTADVSPAVGRPLRRQAGCAQTSMTAASTGTASDAAIGA